MNSVSRIQGAWWGSFIGDALAMPAHWYYQRHLIPRDYGNFETYVAPRSEHPDSILWRSEYPATGPDILHEQAAYWGRRGVHYHQFLKSGENTLNLNLAVLLAESLVACGGYDAQDYLDRYMAFFLSSGQHRDTYIEECHRGFFQNLAVGITPKKCGISDKHIGGLAAIFPLVAVYHRDVRVLVEVVERHVALTHKNADVVRAATSFARLLAAIFEGASVGEALRICGPAAHPAFSFAFSRWAQLEKDEDVVGRRFSPACYIEDAFPAALYLAVKYEGKLREGLQANVMLGGDSCHRGVVLGALLGASGGLPNVPPAWITGLLNHDKLSSLAESLCSLSSHTECVSR